MEADLPYRAEYAKSARASCRGCKSNIGKDVLRLAVMVQSPAFDGKTPNWYHYSCFFAKQRPKTVDDIQHVESLRWEDQEKIKEKIKSLESIIVPKGKGKKRASSASSGALKDFRIELAKSGRAACRGCEQKILKDEVRIAKKDFTTDIGKKYGGQDMWHHLNCFAKLRSELGYFADGGSLPGYNSLDKATKSEVQKHLPAIKQEDVPETKKMKKEEEEDPDAELLKNQSKLIFKYRDLLKSRLTKKDLQYLLEANEQLIPVGEERILDRLADLMTFGRLLPCSTCKDGQLVFNKFGYECRGDLTEWTKCAEVFKEPKRVKFVVPKDLAEEHSFLKKYKCVVRKRIIKDVQPTVAVKKEEDEVDSKPKVERERPPLYNMEFVILGVKDKHDIKKKILKLGGKVTTKISESVMAIVSNKDEVEKMGARITSAKDCDVHVVAEEFLQDVQNAKYADTLKLITDKAICDWGSDPSKRLAEEPSTSHKSKSKSIYTKSAQSVTMKLKGGTAVDPDSGLEDVAHVYVSGDDKYTAVLGITDIQRQKNSYYKLQILQSDSGNSFWLFRAWGRTGTTIGGNKLEQMSGLTEAKASFRALYEEKSGNEWDMRHMFQKVPNRLYPIDVDYTDETDSIKIDCDVPSKLPAPVQGLMKLIFNIDDMKRVMLEFELDTEKMPLGKLSKSQIKKAYGVLSELQTMITDAQTNEKLFIDASNRFYTYVPHSAGVDALPLLKKEEQIKQKIDMMDNLMELEIAYNLMKSSSSGSVDAHYEQLKSEIGVLARDSVEFGIIEEYVKNTHAPTHDAYELVITEVFTVQRQGEAKRFKPFKKMHNRQLLWHGSRATNFAGIISQGLRIAPPEAPITGYMFGKGVYFADMVTKSANYCCTTPRNNTGLLLLCDVALGEMMELKAAKMVQKLPPGKHSCKGIGMTCPDPTVTKKLHGEIEVPLGKPTKCTTKSSLLYNEYIVYDVAQVNIKYLVQTEFKYKRF